MQFEVAKSCSLKGRKPVCTQRHQLHTTVLLCSSTAYSLMRLCDQYRIAYNMYSSYSWLLTLLPVFGLIETVIVLTAPIFCAAGLTLSRYGSMFCSVVNMHTCKHMTCTCSCQRQFKLSACAVLSCCFEHTFALINT
jgi:hypothetical protein